MEQFIFSAFILYFVRIIIFIIITDYHFCYCYCRLIIITALITIVGITTPITMTDNDVISNILITIPPFQYLL